MKKSNSSHKETLSDRVRGATFLLLIAGALCIVAGTVLYVVGRHNFQQFVSESERIRATVTGFKGQFVETKDGRNLSTTVFLTFEIDGHTFEVVYPNYPNHISRSDVGGTVEVFFNPGNGTFTVDDTPSVLQVSVPLWISGVIFTLPFAPCYFYRKTKRHQREELAAEGRFVWADIVNHKKQYVKPSMYFRAICEYRDGGEIRIFKSDWFEGGSTRKTSEMEKGKVKVWYDGAKRYFVDIDDFYDRIFEEIMKEIESEWDKEAE